MAVMAAGNRDPSASPIPTKLDLLRHRQPPSRLRLGGTFLFRRALGPYGGARISYLASLARMEDIRVSVPDKLEWRTNSGVARAERTAARLPSSRGGLITHECACRSVRVEAGVALLRRR